jgi:hypothetical protein
VVTLLDVLAVPSGAHGTETYWFVMEHVPGGGLDRRPPMSPHEAARVGAQLAEALAALHEAGIVHCDVKPANVGLTRRGNAKLLDFGAAYRFRGDETESVNGPFSFTPDYAAPELARGGIPQPASDVFGLGATLYALVTGSPPRGGAPADDSLAGPDDDEEDAERLAYWKAEQGVVELDADAVGPLYPVLGAMLRPGPDRRPAAAEAARLLASVAGLPPGLPAAAPAVEPGPRAVAPPWWRRPRPAAVAGLVVAVAVAGLVVIPGLGGDGGDGGDGAAGRDPAGQDTAAPAPPSLIGDPRTADLCALADPVALGVFGDAEPDEDYGNFHRCDVLIHLPDGTSRMDVEIQLRHGQPPEADEPVRTVGDIHLMAGPPEDDECRRVLLPAAGIGDDGLLVGIRVNMGEGEVAGGTATLCRVADAAAQSAATVLDQGPLPRRSPGYPPESLVWADACTLLEPAELSVVPGLAADDPEEGVANWECEWAGDTDELEAEVAFHREQPPMTAADAEPIRLGDRDAFVEPEEDSDEPACSVFVEYRRYGGHNAEPAVEMLRVDVGGQRPVDDLCAMATSLAGSAAARLPTP